MALNVCIGPAFTTGSTGELEINSAVSRAWPFAGPITTNNGLYVDPGGGLWVAPRGVYTITDNQSQTSLSISVTAGSSWTAPPVNRAITNPSPTSQMLVNGTAIFNIYATPASTANFVLSMWGQADDSTVSSDPLFYNTVFQTGVQVNQTAFVAYPFTFTIPAAGTKSIAYSTGIRPTVLGATVTAWNVYTKAVGILIDPTQAGGTTPL